uniref:GLOBIN domain-containing protein n=1 Tax=Syphacia muris TaxID=451379 RepID=A0A0N5AMD6_9BILA
YSNHKHLKISYKQCVETTYKYSHFFRSNIVVVFLEMSMKLTPIQRQAIIVTWKAIKPQAPSFFRKCFTDLENKSSKVKQIFYKTAVLGAFNRDGTLENPSVATIEEHVKLVIDMFNDIVQNVEKHSEVIIRVRRIGQAHAHLNQTCLFNPDIWDRFGETLMERFSSHDAVQKTREAGKAWRIVIATITGELRYGFVSKARSYTR